MTPAAPSVARHPVWMRCTHWIAALSIALLAFTGVVILMAHPRLYWGEVGNDLTPALIELPISRNHRHGGWTPATPFTPGPGSPVTASRTYEIFNQNSWGRSLHFLAAWTLVAAGVAYVGLGVLTGHLRRRVVPTADDLRPARIAEDVRRHVRLEVAGGAGAPYGTLQKWAYSAVVFGLVPLAALTGLAMSPAVTAAVPSLLTLFGGMQSARTIHFGTWAALVAFALVHLAMVIATGFRRQVRAMTIGG
ncbi:hypothetical protein TBR22_A14920 [Luteitalea sp. TBR-22]|uniref:cytochrome b/b6 domain-containing protein n=1 Tax=Luteitalea sp. TBR-22 TaxID=2802971 RepID=UPI001AFABDD4|nr:cytochrome b/b6 domain-containing protein [Luteitalea sp. TBR-22]BCS32282.1 hypothetical protein TBR22_A14920 [Luteitalea sp. TBR-22]